ncbi:DUF2316 family protein [Fructobacillus sp. CRL 2054]|uniref:DUF2316 family protein n=1 Tax=Fructobacillus sp. CRL 2054 TaxID=2763007 RepID=UPI002379E155|nr:DUF2316 family protein [Fructobacillus sp. CRL 2054]MDD9138771.1 DUF2316 family protein [Fructobacillus sp. CRL 2054]
MSLNPTERVNTIRELNENFQLLGWPIERVAEALKTSPQHLEDVLQLKTSFIEEPWILKIFLEKELLSEGKKPIAFSKLTGDPSQYWFLEQSRIEAGHLAN